jgi:hypothetical protein
VRTLVRRTVVAGALVASAASTAAAQNLTWTGSLGYTTGSYIFSEPTHSFALSNGLSFRHSRFRMSGSLPLIYQNTSAVTFIRGVPVPTGGPDGGTVGQRTGGETVPMKKGTGRGAGGMQSFSAAMALDTITGPTDYTLHLADPTFALGFELLNGTGWLNSLEITAGAKAPIASIESGVGTEAWDVGGGVSVAGGTRRMMLFADVAYWSYGDMPDLVLEDGLSYGAGVGVFATDRMSLIASFSGMERLVPTADPYASIAVAGTYAVSDRGRMSLGAGFGLTESAADVSIFMGWSVALARSPAVYSLAR